MPLTSTDTSSISAYIHENGSLMVLDSASDTYGVGRLRSNQDGVIQESGGNCHINSLAVVRRRTNYSEIDHSGFSATITSRNDIIINVGNT